MGVISSFVMNLRDVSANGESRDFTVTGDADSKFHIQALKTTGEFYNWITQQWASGFDSRNNNEVTISGDAFSSSIVFPATTGEYFITLFSTPESGTTFAKSSGAAGVNILRKKITQVANSTLTFNTVGVGGADALKTSPTTAVTSSPTSLDLINNAIDWDVENVENDGRNFTTEALEEALDCAVYLAAKLIEIQTINETAEDAKKAGE